MRDPDGTELADVMVYGPEAALDWADGPSVYCGTLVVDEEIELGWWREHEGRCLEALGRSVVLENPAIAEQRRRDRWWQDVAYGAGRMPLRAAADLVGPLLGVAFHARDGDARGDYLFAGTAGAEIGIVDNYAGRRHPQDSGESPTKEPDFPEHRTLVYVETVDRAWWESNQPLLAGAPGITELYMTGSDIPWPDGIA